MMTHPSLTAKSKQQGVALIASLIIMLLMTILAISVFRSNNLLEKIAGNTREKQRALQSAQDALQYGEWWLQQSGSNLVPVPSCSATAVPTVIQVCPNNQDPGPTLANVSALKYFPYTPPNMASVTSGATGAIVKTGATINDVVYSSSPGFVIHYLGIVNSQKMFRVTAIGYGGGGGANGTQAIVQSIFLLGGSGAGATPTKNLGN
ncbi:pilus assembly PilX family protein [Sapientia aquatica]|uniref:Pilus assembly protein PilX n=1 Tax=Sapientia aquatica TaxID=1549640 RepID=A0A4R5W4S5_9BURK|nr:PilX N-terminal domain-containing pilus assembly protein [Sapientia aquatica]TDK68019.1 pilus assembly protein PilX [Sapientia aquatica]